MKEANNHEIVKKNWSLPEIYILEIKATNSGATSGTPEDQGYDPIISP